jgi:hypothetical protein
VHQLEDYVLKSLETEVSNDGSVVRFTFVLADGSRNQVIVPFVDLGPMILVMEQQAAKKALAAIKASLRGADRRFLPIRPRALTKLDGAIHQGNCILSLELDGKLALDLSFSQENLSGMIEWLKQLQLRSCEPEHKPS